MLSGRSLGEKNLTSSQSKVLRYILDHAEEVAFLPISALARRTGVSEATVVRLAQAMGFKGFPELKREIQGQIRERISTVSRLERTIDEVGKGDEEAVLIRVFQEDMRNLAETLQEISIRSFREAIRELERAKRVFVVGLRSAYSLAIFFGTALRYLGKEVVILKPDHGELWDLTMGWRKGDLVIGISFPRYTRTTVEIVREAKGKGIRTIGITDNPLSPLARYADIVLLAKCGIESYIESFTAPLSLINALLTALSLKDPKRTLRSLQRFERIWGEKEIYLYRKEGTER